MPITFIDLDGFEPKIGDQEFGRNVILGSKRYKEFVHPSNRDKTNKNWIASDPKTLKQATSFINEIKSTNDGITLNNLVISPHGFDFPDGSKGLSVSPNPSLVPNEEIHTETINSFLQMQKVGLEKVLKNDKGAKEWYDENGKFTKDLQDLMNTIEDGGTLVLLSCDTASDPELMKALYKLSGERINIIANQSMTKITFDETNSYSNLLDGYLYNKESDDGWLIIGPKTEGELKSINNQIILSRDEEPIQY
jgi:hypothetical protein